MDHVVKEISGEEAFLCVVSAAVELEEAAWCVVIQESIRALDCLLKESGVPVDERWDPGK